MDFRVAGVAAQIPELDELIHVGVLIGADKHGLVASRALEPLAQLLERHDLLVPVDDVLLGQRDDQVRRRDPVARRRLGQRDPDAWAQDEAGGQHEIDQLLEDHVNHGGDVDRNRLSPPPGKTH